jgi:Ni/Fe-hydrogenase subunit HybB-like protein
MDEAFPLIIIVCACRGEPFPTSFYLVGEGSMKETAKRPWFVSAAVFSGLGLSIFLVGAVMGYCDGAFRNGGDTAKGLDWALKNGLLLFGMSTFIGVFSVLVFSRLRLPAFIGWAFVMGLSFAIMTGGGILLGMNDKAFWPETIKQFILGTIVGAIAGPLIQRNQMRRNQTTQLKSEASNE